MSAKAEQVRMICIICPMGCELDAEIDKERNKVIDVKGVRCPKGKDYAYREIADPRRVLIAVVKVKDGHLPIVSVKTVKPIPKARIFEAVRSLSKVVIEAPVNAGDTVIHDLLDTGISVIATNNVKKVVLDNEAHISGNCSRPCSDKSR